MARKPRIHYTGAFYHVILRGNARQAIFRGQDDILRFETILGQGVEKYDLRIYAYCWMPNHVHMALQVSEIPLSKMMQTLSQRYTRWFNHRYDRVGHLFQGRYKAILVDDQGYLLELIRYIHLNPVRAGLVSDAADYGNSSHGAYLDPNRSVAWLSVDPALKLFDSTESAAQTRYLHFMGQPVDEERLDALRKGNQQGRILGDAEFVQKVVDKSDTPEVSDMGLNTLTRIVAEKMTVSDTDILSSSRCRKTTQARAMIALLAVDNTQHSLRDVAGYLNRDITTLCKQVSKLRRQREKFSSIQGIIEELTATITP